MLLNAAQDIQIHYKLLIQFLVTPHFTSCFTRVEQKNQLDPTE